MRRILGLLVAVATVWLVLPTLSAQAHYVGTSQVVVSSASGDNTTMLLDVQVPLANLDAAYGTDLARDPASAVDSADTVLRSLLADRVSVTTIDGAEAGLVIDALAVGRREGHDTLHAAMTVTLPAAPPPSTGPVVSPVVAVLHWDLVSDVVYSDKAFLAQTGSDGVTDLVGVLTHQDPAATLSLQSVVAQQPDVGFVAMVWTGFDHFREGIDHQLFLCVLAVGAIGAAGASAAPGGRGGVRGRALRLTALTLCFTAGHSLSLAVATLGWVEPPSRLVETAIALTIAAAALHAVRPVLGGATELALTTAFGLVHGFGFAGTLSDLTLDGSRLAVPLLGFNVGLEAAQVMTLALLAVPVWLVCRSRVATTAMVVAVVVVSLSWVVQRALDTSNPLDELVAAILTSPERLALVVLVLGLVGGVVARQPAPAPGVAATAATAATDS